MSSFLPSNSQAQFLPTSQDFQVDDIQLRIVLSQRINDFAFAINNKEIANHDLVEIITGQQWFDSSNAQKKRQAFRKVFSFGSIAAGATLTIAHGITGVTLYTVIRGACVTDAIDFRPIPFVSTAAVNQQISIRVTGANIEIINGAAAANITSGVAVLEFLKT